jgi:hypothetical protein
MNRPTKLFFCMIARHLRASEREPSPTVLCLAKRSSCGIAGTKRGLAILAGASIRQRSALLLRASRYGRASPTVRCRFWSSSCAPTQRGCGSSRRVCLCWTMRRIGVTARTEDRASLKRPHSIAVFPRH